LLTGERILMAKKTKGEVKKMEEDKVEKTDEVIDESQHSENVSSIKATPTSRVAAMSQAVNLIGAMSGEDLNHFMDVVKSMQGGTAAHATSGKEPGNKSSISTHSSAASPSVQGVVKEAITDIFGGDETLSEEFKIKTEALFEAAVSAHVAMAREAILEEVEAEKAEEVKEIENTLLEKFDTYVSHAAVQWLEENQVAIDSTLRNEITESVVAGIRDVFLENNLDVPEDKIDVVEALEAKVAELQDKLNESMKGTIELTKELEEVGLQKMIGDVSEGLALTEKEKFRTYVEDITFNTPEECETKLLAIKEKYFPKTKKLGTDVLNEDTPADEVTQELSEDMKQYLAASKALSSKRS
jgi:hypothetical protein